MKYELTQQEHLQNIVVESLEERYRKWIALNPKVFELFCDYTFEAINCGKEKISHWLVVNRIRWEVEIVTISSCEQDCEFKISNDYIAFLARDFIEMYPKHKGIFNLKAMKRA